MKGIYMMPVTLRIMTAVTLLGFVAPSVSCRPENDLFDFRAQETTRSAINVQVGYLYKALAEEKASVQIEPLTADGKAIEGGLWQSSVWIEPGRGQSAVTADLQTARNHVQSITTTKIHICIAVTRNQEKNGFASLSPAVSQIFCRDFSFRKTWYPHFE
jgi:hypothetical protein